SGKELPIVHIRAMSSVFGAAGASVDTNPLPLRGREPFQHTVVEADEGPEQLLRRIEFCREPAFREVDLHVVGTLRQATPDVALGLANEVIEELGLRVA